MVWLVCVSLGKHLVMRGFGTKRGESQSGHRKDATGTAVKRVRAPESVG